jgi:hypothetical protein
MPQEVLVYSRDAFDSWVSKKRNNREVGWSFICSRSKLIPVSDQKPSIHGLVSGYSRGVPGDYIPYRYSY